MIYDKVARFVRKPLPDQWAAIKATFIERRRHKLLTGTHAPPKVLQQREKMYVAHRPDSDVFHQRHPEIAWLSEMWIRNNVIINASDLPRLYALIFNIKQVLDENIMGDMAELGVYRETRRPCSPIIPGNITEGCFCLILLRDLTSGILSVSMNQRRMNSLTRR